MSTESEPAQLGRAYGPWLDEARTMRTVYAVYGRRHGAAGPEVLVSMVGEERDHAFVRTVGHAPLVKLWRPVESFGSVFVGTPTVRPAAVRARIRSTTPHLLGTRGEVTPEVTVSGPTAVTAAVEEPESLLWTRVGGVAESEHCA